MIRLHLSILFLQMLHCFGVSFLQPLVITITKSEFTTQKLQHLN